MSELPLGRRSFLAMSGTLAAWHLVAAPSLSDVLVREGSASGGVQRTLLVLSPAEAAAFTAFAAQVIPSEAGSPGACEANVTRFADTALARYIPEQLPAFRAALAMLDAESVRQHPESAGFTTLDASAQTRVMQVLDTTQRDAFDALRLPVLSGMFANPGYGGNAGKVGWKLIGFEDRFFWTAPFGDYDRPSTGHDDD